MILDQSKYNDAGPISGPGFSMPVQIRSIAAEDLPAVVELLKDFAELQQMSEYLEVDEAKLAAGLFGECSTAEGLVAHDDGRIIGYALFYPNFSSFRGERGLYLEDLFVAGEYRKMGIGERLIREVARIAAARGFVRIDFSVLKNNHAAQRFYRRLGAESNPDDIHFKISAHAFRNLAQTE